MVAVTLGQARIRIRICSASRCGEAVLSCTGLTLLPWSALAPQSAWRRSSASAPRGQSERRSPLRTSLALLQLLSFVRFTPDSNKTGTPPSTCISLPQMDSVHRLDYSQGRPAAGPAPAYQGPPPPRPPPPSYFAAVRRRVPSSLRPVLLFATFLSFIYLIAVAVTSFRYLSSSTETAKLKLFDIISGVLYLVGAVTEAFGLYAVWTSKLPLVLLHARASVVGLVVVVAAQIINIVSHYTGKKDIIDGCTAKYTGAAACTGYSSWWGGWGCSQSEPLSATDAANYCQSNWQKESIWVFVW